MCIRIWITDIIWKTEVIKTLINDVTHTLCVIDDDNWHLPQVKYQMHATGLSVNCISLLIWLEITHVKTTRDFRLVEKVSKRTQICSQSLRVLLVLNTSLSHSKYGNYVLSTATTFLVRQPRFEYDLTQSYLRTGRTGWIFKHAWRPGIPFPSTPVHSVLTQTKERLYSVHCVSTAFQPVLSYFQERVANVLGVNQPLVHNFD